MQAAAPEKWREQIVLRCRGANQSALIIGVEITARVFPYSKAGAVFEPFCSVGG